MDTRENDQGSCCLIDTVEGVRLYVHVIPGGSKDQVEGIIEGPQERRYLKVRIKAPAIEGKANHALCSYLAKQWKVATSALAITSGESARRKTIVLKGISAEKREDIRDWLKQQKGLSKPTL